MRLYTHQGQSLLEAVVAMPLFLTLLFFVIQIGHLGIAMAVVNYAASSAARQAVEKNDVSASTVDQKFKDLLTAGLQSDTIKSTSDGDPITPNVEISACAKLQAYPFVGEFLNKGLTATVSGGCAAGDKAFGPVALKGSGPYYFVIEGHTWARMNYVTTKS
jgi:Flp pilus assembly protein TadG